MLSVSTCTGAGTLCGVTLAGGAPLTSASGIYDWSYYSISSRTQWNITKDFYVGLEGYYGHLNTASKGLQGTFTSSPTSAQPTGIRVLTDQNVYVYRMRVHRDIVP
jgi:hypothetical protein